jgi:GT2 family glycosyltransferase
VLVDNRPHGAASSGEAPRVPASGDDGTADRQILRIREPGPFNFAALCNAGARAAAADVLVFLNDDVRPLHSEWLHELVSLAIQPGIGPVGARLWYPDGRLQHAGIVLGIGGAAGHAYKYRARSQPAPLGRTALPHTVSAVTGACLAIRRDTYVSHGGFDERFPVAFNDVDLCLRLSRAGLPSVWTPYANLEHDESATRGTDLRGPARRRYLADRRRLTDRWGAALRADPWYNPNLSLEDESFRLAWPPRERTVR